MLKIGDIAPNFKAIKTNLEVANFYDYKAKIKIIVSVPSIDTGICDLEVKKFNEKLGHVKDLKIIVLSKDLPFAQQRWCGKNNVNNVEMLSDYQGGSFTKDFDALLDDLKLLKRAIFIVDDKHKLIYVQYCKTEEHPDYEKAFEFIKSKTH